jgi:hypothetical protein
VEQEEEIEGMVVPHRRITPNPLQKASYPESVAVHRGDVRNNLLGDMYI